MITIQNGKFNIPEDERFIGFAGDNLRKRIEILVKDEAGLNDIHRLYLVFDDNSVNFFVLPSRMTDEGLVLTWDILESHLFKSGIVKIQVKAFCDGGVIWHTNSDTIIVGKTADFPDTPDAQKNAEFLEYERTLNEIREEINQGKNLLPYIGENGNWFVNGVDTGVRAEGKDGASGDSLHTYYSDADSAPDIDSLTDFGIYHFQYSEAKFILIVSGMTNLNKSHLMQIKISFEGLSYRTKLSEQYNWSQWYSLNGTSPNIGENGNWYIGDIDTGVKARGEDGAAGSSGADGITPHAGEDGYWYIGDNKTNTPAQAPQIFVKEDVYVQGSSGGYTLRITQPGGGTSIHISNGSPGDDGHTPQKGVDYWTAEDKAEIMSESLVPTFVNSVDDMTDTSKAYVLISDSNIYVYGEHKAGADYTNVLPFATDKAGNIYDNVGYRNGYRISTTGFETAKEGVGSTGYIPVSQGDIVRFKNCNISTTLDTSIVQIALYNSSKELISGCTTNSANTSIRIPTTINGSEITAIEIASTEAWGKDLSSVAFIRITSTGFSPESVITVNEELSEESESITGWRSTGLSYVPASNQEQVNENSSNISNHESRLSFLESGNKPELPDYWQSEIDSLKEKMRERQANGNDAFQFVWFSDMHGKNDNTKNIGLVSQAVCEQYNIPFTCLSGDIMWQGWRTTAEAVYTDYDSCNEILNAVEKERLLCTIGNHDGAWGYPADLNDDGTDDYYIRDIGNKALYNLIYRRQACDLNRVFSKDGTYFYVDSKPQKVRFIMLNFHTDGDGSNDSNGYAVYNSMKNFVLGSKQLEWLINDALNVDENWNIVIMGHPPISNAEDGSLFADIINAYNGRTAYAGGSINLENDFWGKNISSEYNTSTAPSKDFSQAKGEVIAYFHGHIHRDTIDETALSCPAISITTASSDVRDENPPERVIGTATETAMDIVTVDKAVRTIYLTRLGAGEDRQISY